MGGGGRFYRVDDTEEPLGRTRAPASTQTHSLSLKHTRTHRARTITNADGWTRLLVLGLNSKGGLACLPYSRHSTHRLPIRYMAGTSNFNAQTMVTAKPRITALEVEQVPIYFY